VACEGLSWTGWERLYIPSMEGWIYFPGIGSTLAMR
jgi:hypothetical protein